MATTSTGQVEPATLVAVDTVSDVGVVRVATSLPAARVVDWSQVRPGSAAIEMAVAAEPSQPGASVWWTRRSRRPATRSPRGPAPAW